MLNIKRKLLSRYNNKKRKLRGQKITIDSLIKLLKIKERENLSKWMSDENLGEIRRAQKYYEL